MIIRTGCEQSRKTYLGRKSGIIKRVFIRDFCFFGVFYEELVRDLVGAAKLMMSAENSPETNPENGYGLLRKDDRR